MKSSRIWKIKTNISNFVNGSYLSQIKDLNQRLNNHIQIIHLGVSLQQKCNTDKPIQKGQSKGQLHQPNKQKSYQQKELLETLKLPDDIANTIAMNQQAQDQNTPLFKLQFWSKSKKSIEVAERESFDLIQIAKADLPYQIGRSLMMSLPQEQYGYLSKIHCRFDLEAKNKSFSSLNMASKNSTSRLDRKSNAGGGMTIQKKSLLNSQTKKFQKSQDLSSFETQAFKSPPANNNSLNSDSKLKLNERSKSNGNQSTGAGDEDVFATAQEQPMDLNKLFGQEKKQEGKTQSAILQSYDFILTDLSMNGTFVNGEKLGKNNSKILENGDQICLVKPKNKEGVLGFKFLIID